jgi:ribosomal protein L11 methyltransferase
MWLSVTFPVDGASVEAFSDALLAQGALSVSVEDAYADTEREQPQFGEPGAETVPLWAHSLVVALFPPGSDIAALAREAAACAGLDPAPGYTVTEVAEQNWVQLTQAQFDPLAINERLWIVPSWHQAPDPRAINLILDPGMAFGTGSHPTTRLCLEWLCRAVTPGASVLDYGCGSGILAIAAARLGASQVTGVDIDDNALAAAADNAARNGVQLTLRHSREPLAARFDIVVANILANPLCLLAPLLVRLTQKGGRIALSGILEGQAEQVRAAYRPALELVVDGARDGWVLLEGVRR